MDLDELEKDTILLHIDENERMSDLAILSLRIALKSYFTTYSSIKYRIGALKFNSEGVNLFTYNYYEEYSKVIVYLHHFFELIIKEYLRNEDELLVIDFVRDPLILHKLIKKQEISPEEYNKIFTIEFSKSLRMLVDLVKSKSIYSDGRIDFLIERKNVDALIKLNNFRNRIVHRGSFILKYKSLDIFIGKYLLPIIKKILELNEGEKLGNVWKYKNNFLGIDVIDEIINVFEEVDYNMDKVAYLKEIGRASYENPLNSSFKIFDDQVIRRTTEMLNYEEQSQNVSKIIKCPVCGQRTLTIYEDEELNIDEEGQMIEHFRYTYEAKCYCCTFEVNHHLANPRECDLDITDLWYGEDIV
ncbi:hypothetical protein GOQ27_14395 [Clostridium sp. D2Q-11]|uniref:Uncharacterized protein n=1 Tax=Anaeromonas frigoriresistens TaxID=2683708 RepID=A0A942Z7K5_9FIRM|nr:hypothetical protein [Anaeromonas frigoriresistens]MBS4539661.1 hypothetical protein [Anaeromonas frigoriresistens]